MALIEAGLDFLNGADLPALPVTTLAESLQTWSRLTAKRAAAEAVGDDAAALWQPPAGGLRTAIPHFTEPWYCCAEPKEPIWPCARPAIGRQGIKPVR